MRQPHSLLELCDHASGKFVYDNLCCKIERTYGGYDQAACVTVVAIVQQYLLKWLLSMVDSVGLRAIKRHLLLNTLNDCRILYALIIHKSMQSLYVLSGHCKIDQHRFYDFILNKLPMLPNLTYLDLQGISFTHEMLEVIVYTSKRLRSLIVQMPLLCNSNRITNSEFAHLSQLDSLHVLKDSSGQNFMYINSDIVLNLIITLKYLKEIDYINIGQVLDNYVHMQSTRQYSSSSSRIAHNPNMGINPLGLTHIKIIASFMPVYDSMDEIVRYGQDPSPNVIFTVAQACPKLDHLGLLNFEKCSDIIRNKFLYNLTTSTIRVSSLMMDGFVINDNFEEFLKEKGQYLKTFLLSPLKISRGQVEKIQQLCPNVPNLRFEDYTDDTELHQFSKYHNFCIVGGI